MMMPVNGGGGGDDDDDGDDGDDDNDGDEEDQKAECVLSVSGFLVVYTRGRRTYVDVDGQVTTTHKPALLCHTIK